MLLGYLTHVMGEGLIDTTTGRAILELSEQVRLHVPGPVGMTMQLQSHSRDTTCNNHLQARRSIDTPSGRPPVGDTHQMADMQ